MNQKNDPKMAQPELEAFSVPTMLIQSPVETATAILQSKSPLAEGIECLYCDFTSESVDKIKAHFFQFHPDEEFKAFEKFVSLSARRITEVNDHKSEADLMHQNMEDQQKVFNKRLEEQNCLVQQTLQAMDKRMQHLCQFAKDWKVKVEVDDSQFLETEEKHSPSSMPGEEVRVGNTDTGSAPDSSFGVNFLLSDVPEEGGRIKDETAVSDSAASDSNTFTWVKLEAVDDADDEREDEGKVSEDCWIMGNSSVGSDQPSSRLETRSAGRHGLRDCFVRLMDIMKCPSMVKSSRREESRKRVFSESQPDPVSAKAGFSASGDGGVCRNVRVSSASANCTSHEEILKRPYRLRSDRQRAIEDDWRRIHAYKRRKVHEASEQLVDLRVLLHIPSIPSLPRAVGKVCPICSLSFHSPALANMHVLSRHCRKMLNQSAELACPGCEELVDGPLGLYGHVVFIHDNNPDVAEEARWRWLNKLTRLGVDKVDEMYLYDKKSNNVQEMMCPLCGGCAGNSDQLTDHILSVHWTQLTESVVTCRVCGQEPSGSVYDHIRQVHPSKLQSFQRSVAALAYTSQNISSTSFVAVSKPSRDISTRSLQSLNAGGNSRSTVCLLRGKAYSQSSLLECHISHVHRKGKQGVFHCHACDEIFTQYFWLYRHIRETHKLDHNGRSMRSKSPVSTKQAIHAAKPTVHDVPRSSLPQGLPEACSQELTIGEAERCYQEPTAIEETRDCDDDEASTDQKGSKNRPLVSRCPLCEKFHLSVSKVNDHIVSAHSLQLTKKQYLFKCPLCSVADRNYPSVYMHVRISHADTISERELTQSLSYLSKVRESGSYQHVLNMARQYSEHRATAKPCDDHVSDDESLSNDEVIVLNDQV